MHTSTPVDENNFRALVEKSIEGMLVADQAARIIYTNQHAAEILGYSRQELTARHLEAIIAPRCREDMLTRLHRRLQGLHEPTHYESVFVRKDGKAMPVLLSAALGNWRGAPASIMIFHDITLSKQAEEELRQNERKFGSLINNLPGMIYRCRNGRERSMLFVSQGAKDLTGYDPEDILQGGVVSFDTLIQREDRPRVRKVIQQCLGNQKPWRLEYRISQRSRRERWVWEQGSGVYTPDGQLKYLEGFITDITEHKLTEEALRRTEDRRIRAEQLAYVGEMAARLNHEIKNPLATIRTGLELISRDLPPDHSNRVVLDTVVGEIKNVNQLVSDLLSAAAIDRFQPRPVELSMLLQEAMLSFKPLARRKQIELDFACEEHPVVITFDTKAFRRFFGNLMINAFDVLPPGGRISVEHRLVSQGMVEQLFSGYPGQVVALSVSDNGPGIPREVIELVFNPFFTTKTVGTGLGLSIAHDIIEAHGGLLTVSSEPGSGARFTAYLPVGERPPCYTIVPEKKEACHDCTVEDSDLCWLHHRSAQTDGAGGIRDCLSCPVYQRYNLTYYSTTLEPEVSKCKVPYFWWTMNSI